jgi:superfamily II DNA or RNA helicase
MTFSRIKNKITIKNPTKEAKDIAKSKLKKENPEYSKSTQYRAKFYMNDKYINYYKLDEVKQELTIDAQNIRFFISLIDDLEYKKLTKQKAKNREIREAKNKIKEIKKVKLHDYQELAVDLSINKIKEGMGGLIVSPPGSGKTEIMIEIIKKAKLKTLIVVHTIDLAEQVMNRLDASSSFLLSRISSSNFQKEKAADVSIATIQTLYSIADRIKDDFDLIIYDEAHHYYAQDHKKETKTKRTIDKLNGIRLGFTATNYRHDDEKDTKGFSIECVFGEIIHEVKKQEAAQNITEGAKLKILLSKFSLYDLRDKDLNIDGTLNYSKLINAICENEKRNKIIIDEIIERTKEKRKIIILSERVEHILHINEELRKEGIKSEAFIAKTKKEERSKILENARNGEVDAIVASFKIFSEGIDLKNFDTIFLTCSRKFEGTLSQAIGRIERKHEGKKEGLIIDLIDPEIGILNKMAKERLKFYKKNKING